MLDAGTAIATAVRAMEDAARRGRQEHDRVDPEEGGHHHRCHRRVRQAAAGPREVGALVVAHEQPPVARHQQRGARPLDPADPAAAAALARAVSDPSSPSYQQYVTPVQFRQQFAPSATSLQAVQSWLKQQGFSVVYTPANRHYVAAGGTVAQAEAAFGVQFGIYKVKGISVRSPSADLKIPTSLANVISGVVGLDDSAVFVTTDHLIDKKAPPTGGFRNAPPLSDYWAEFVSPYAYPTGFTDASTPATAPWTVKGYTPDQIKGAYGISSEFDGAGQTVAIIDAYASPTILQDVNQWSINRGLPPMTPAQLVQVVPPGIYRRPQNPAQDPQGWYGEETLDVEAVHGMAPAAKILFVGAPNNYQDLDAAMNHVVDQHLAQIVTNSYGFSTELLPPGYVKPFEQTLIQAAAEGIGVYFSSGVMPPCASSSVLRAFGDMCCKAPSSESVMAAWPSLRTTYSAGSSA